LRLQTGSYQVYKPKPDPNPNPTPQKCPNGGPDQLHSLDPTRFTDLLSHKPQISAFPSFIEYLGPRLTDFDQPKVWTHITRPPLQLLSVSGRLILNTRRRVLTTNPSVLRLRTRVYADYKPKCIETTNRSADRIVWTLQTESYRDYKSDRTDTTNPSVCRLQIETRADRKSKCALTKQRPG
jgi:hypothetical protein